jgi:hypothetical protein
MLLERSHCVRMSVCMCISRYRLYLCLCLYPCMYVCMLLCAHVSVCMCISWYLLCLCLRLCPTVSLCVHFFIRLLVWQVAALVAEGAEAHASELAVVRELVATRFALQTAAWEVRTGATTTSTHNALGCTYTFREKERGWDR